MSRLKEDIGVSQNRGTVSESGFDGERKKDVGGILGRLGNNES